MNFVEQQKYRFSFTAASLMCAEMNALVIELIENNLTLNELSPSTLNKTKDKTNVRQFKELSMRLNTLTEKELDIFPYLPREEKILLCYITCIRAYRFFREFVDEVVLENIAIFKYTINDLDYNTFFNKKASEFSEVDRLTDSTRQKVKQVTFKLLEQAGLIDNIKDRNMLRPHVSMKLQSILVKDQWRYIFIN